MTLVQSKPKFWDETAEDFDAIYSEKERGVIGVWLDQWLRKDIYQRLDETVRRVSALGNEKSVLDVGTGTGRLALALAAKGHTCVGVDFSPVMLERAEGLAKQAGFEKQCHFTQGDLTAGIPEGLQQYKSFDTVAFLGVVDYISDTTPLLQNVLTFNPKEVIVTFPMEGTFRSQVRRLRYKLQGLDCPLYFYTVEQIKALGEVLLAKETDIISMGELHYTVFKY